MKCTRCEGKTKVVDSRPMLEDQIIYRRRECTSCGKRVTTYEQKEARSEKQ